MTLPTRQTRVVYVVLIADAPEKPRAYFRRLLASRYAEKVKQDWPAAKVDIREVELHGDD